MNDLAFIHTQAGICVVDADVFPALTVSKWHTSKDGYIMGSRGGKTISIARAIINVPEGMQPDHKNGIPWDNRKCNLRAATINQNQQNQGKRRGGTSQFKGVYWSIYHKSWRAQIRVDRRKIHLGTFKTESLAALAYNEAASFHFGEFARLNIVTKLEVSGEQKGSI